MIRFENLTKGFWVDGRYRVVIDNLNAVLESGRSLALLGRNGAGKSTLLKMIAGTMLPDVGKISSDGTISWPVGFSGSFHNDLTGAQNVRFIARIYGVDTDSLVEFVQNFAEIGHHFHMPVRSYSSGMRSRLAFGTSMGIKFDTYLVDEITAVGDQHFRKKSQEIFFERMKDSSAILVTHNLPEVRKFCDEGMILEHGKITYYKDLDEAIFHHKKIAS